MVKNTSPILNALRNATANETAAVEFLEAQRFGDAPACPRCGAVEVYKMTSADGSRNADYRWRCRGCKKMFTVRTWVETGGEGELAGWWDCGLISPPPTHWMPLPMPPESAK